MSTMLERQVHMVIEAANGTGKTITALSGVLPYARRHQKKIVYLARTHSQMDRVIEELQEISKTKQVSGIALRGRGSMCLNPLVKKHAKTNQAVQDMCQQLKTAKKCEYYNNMKKEAVVLPVLTELSRKPVTASIILDMAEAAYICPADTAKMAIARVDVVACSYLYLFEPDIRESFLENMQAELNDLIIIIDECHNLPENVNQITSDEVSTFSFNRAIREARNNRKADMVKFLEACNDELIKRTKKQKYNDEIAVDPAIFLETIDFSLDGIELGEHFFNDMIDLGNEIRYRLAKRNKEPRSSIGRIGEFFARWFQSIGRIEFTHSLEKQKFAQSGDVFVTLRLDSLDPSVAILPVLEEVHLSLSISGSIGDPDAYMMLTGIDQLRSIPNILPSPYQNTNITALVTDDLTTSYRQRSPVMWKKIVNMIAAVVENTPTNTGIFAPSFAILNELMDNGLESAVSKRVFHVERGLTSAENDRMVNRFKRMADKGGAVLVGVLGGRSSEGADFPGEMMQSVIVVGIPYAPPNVRVQAQIKYLEEKFPKRGRKLAYQLPAVNRASQAAGRPVRGLDDRAFILLADQRFGRQDVMNQLPGWIRDTIEKIGYNPPEVANRVKRFFQ